MMAQQEFVSDFAKKKKAAFGYLQKSSVVSYGDILLIFFLHVKYITYLAAW